MRRVRANLLPLVLVALGCGGPAAGPPDGTQWARLDSTGRLRQVQGDFVEAANSPEAAARGVLARHATRFDLDGVDLVLEQTRQGRAGTYLRFGQRAEGLVVFDAQVIVLVDQMLHVRSLNLAHRRVPAVPRQGIADATARAAALAGAPVGAAVRSVALGIEPDGTLTYRARLATSSGAWEVTVDAASGAVRGRRDLLRYADGLGLVFDPNPIASTGNTSFVDDHDRTTPALDAARFVRVLPRLDGSGFLRGPWVDSRPKNVKQRAFVPSLLFNYDRSDKVGHFEEVMAYFHIDRAQARIQALGFTDVNNRQQIANVNDFNIDNSFYNPLDKEVSFGVGGVDDAEDAEVILHEYGHSIQDDQVPGYGGGDEGAMGEGFGDYISASFTDTLSPEVTDPNCLADWDSISYSTTSPKCLRRLDSPKHYPEARTGEVHNDGEMWSAALFRARSTVGADVMDTLTLEAHFLMSNDETFQDASDAILATDDNLYGGIHRSPVRRALVWQGVSREHSAPASFTRVAGSANVNIENSRVNGQYPNRLDEVRTYSAKGAVALQVHFARIGTELDPSCLDGACDNIYLYDANGDLYQILNGVQADVLSVQIPGDTVQIRLVTDTSVTGFGYQIDRVDSLGRGGSP